MQIFGFALIVTACSWLWLGTGAPLNDGLRLEFRSSWVQLLVTANLPAAIFNQGWFGSSGYDPEPGYFLCVFIQWLIVGVSLGVVTAVIRRAIRLATITMKTAERMLEKRR